MTKSWAGLLAGPTRGGCSWCTAPGPTNLKLKIEMGNYAQSFYCDNFIHTILCKLWQKLFV